MVSLIMILPLFEMARTSTFVSSHASFLIFPRPPTPLHEHWVCDSFRGITSINRISSIKPWLRCLVFMQAPCPVSSSPPHFSTITTGVGLDRHRRLYSRQQVCSWADVRFLSVPFTCSMRRAPISGSSLNFHHDPCTKPKPADCGLLILLIKVEADITSP